MSSDTENKLSSTALEYLKTHDIPPTPENYMVWYQYAQKKNPLLNTEIDKIITHKMPFSNVVCDTLYQRFCVAERQKIASESAIAAQKMLKEVLTTVSSFSGETQDYNKDLNSYIENISKDFGHSEVNEIIKDIVGATVSLRERGEQMHARLEESKREIDVLRENLQQVSNEAQKDALTGLYNRRAFERILEEYMAESVEKKTNLCLMMIDVDHFKKFNDNYGHLLGDEVLKIVARTLHDSLKGQDVVARFGGEEFVAVLPMTPIEGALRVADAIRLSIASKELKRKDTGQQYGQITVSIGVSSFRRGVDDIPKLIKRADEALYESKRTGRNRVTRES